MHEELQHALVLLNISCHLQCNLEVMEDGLKAGTTGIPQTDYISFLLLLPHTGAPVGRLIARTGWLRFQQRLCNYHETWCTSVRRASCTSERGLYLLQEGLEGEGTGPPHLRVDMATQLRHDLKHVPVVVHEEAAELGRMFGQ